MKPPFDLFPSGMTSWLSYVCRRFLQDTKNVSSFHKSPDSSAFDFKEMFYIPACCDVKLNLSYIVLAAFRVDVMVIRVVKFSSGGLQN